ncbi:putative disease resistance RPP13-like protein 1 [Prosopis cineraria]|uniref:putative disease resistance RPP13-like protein 1 n=1 Tax=Prosopis cineraria TaxID=364024 RepID=UPI0024101B7D|nr:putative disease resistance RPP13-like protein 1 [Prosopis cineraria]
MAAELVARAFLTAFVDTLFDRMASREMLDFIKGVKQSNGLNLQPDKLKMTLRSVDALVNHAEERQAADLHVLEWANDLKDAMFEAEDVLDQIITTISASNLKMEAELGIGINKKKAMWLRQKSS